MRVLLDENVPRKLKYLLTSEHDVIAVLEQGWSSLLNGELLRFADAEFDALVTLDRRFEYQQDLSRLSMGVVIVRAVSNKYEDLRPLVPSIQSALEHLLPGSFTHVAG